MSEGEALLKKLIFSSNHKKDLLLLNIEPPLSDAELKNIYCIPTQENWCCEVAKTHTRGDMLLYP